VRTAGDVTTTSTTLVDLTAASITLTTGAFPTTILFTCTSNTNGLGILYLNVDIDGSLELGTAGIFSYTKIAHYFEFTSIAHQSAALTAASHTFKIQWKVSSGYTGTIEADSATPYSFSVSEIR